MSEILTLNMTSKSSTANKIALLFLHFTVTNNLIHCPSYIPISLGELSSSRIYDIRKIDRESNTMHQRTYHVIATLDW